MDLGAQTRFKFALRIVVLLQPPQQHRVVVPRAGAVRTQAQRRVERLLRFRRPVRRGQRVRQIPVSVGVVWLDT